jgi:hypothetical protein
LQGLQERPSVLPGIPSKQSIYWLGKWHQHSKQ